MLVFLKLNEILRDAVLYNYGADGDKSFYSLAHRNSFEDAPYVCRVTVEETKDGNRTYTVEFTPMAEMKKTDAPTKGRGTTSGYEEVKPLHPSITNILLKNILNVNGEIRNTLIPVFSG